MFLILSRNRPVQRVKVICPKLQHPPVCKAQPSPCSGSGSRSRSGERPAPLRSPRGASTGAGPPQGPARPPGGPGTGVGWDQDRAGVIHQHRCAVPGGQAAAGGGCPDSRSASSYKWCGQYRVGLYSLLLFQKHFLLLLFLVKWWKNYHQNQFVKY